MMKDKEKKKKKKVKKAKKAAVSTKKKAVAKKTPQAKKKKPAPSRKSTPKKNKERGGGKAKEAVKAYRDVNAMVASGDTPGNFLDAGIPDGLEGVIIHEDGTVSYPDHGAGEEAAAGLVEYLMFRYAGSGYSFKLSDVHEILRHQRITPVPRSGRHVIGVTSLRGAIIPVINLASLFSLRDTEQPKKGRILLLRGHGVTLGLLVERAVAIKNIGPNDVNPHLSRSGKDDSGFIEGVINLDGEFFSVLNPDAITGTKATWRLNETEA